MTRIIWALFGAFALSLGTIGIVLPLVPTVPLLLLAAFCFARSSQTLHDWLLNHGRLGPPIDAWRKSGAIGRRAKVWATLSIAMAFALSFAFDLSAVLILLQAVTLGAVAVFIWTRPEE